MILSFKFDGFDLKTGLIFTMSFLLRMKSRQTRGSKLNIRLFKNATSSKLVIDLLLCFESCVVVESFLFYIITSITLYRFCM